MSQLTRVATTLIISMSALASAPASAVSLFLDLSAVGGLGKSGFADEGSSPTMGMYTGELSVGVRVGRVLKLGARTAYSHVIQFSEASESGNRRGYRWAMVSPVLGLCLGRIEIRGDYQFLGDYVLASPDENGNRITYLKPSGYGAELLFLVKPHVAIGARYEKISFSRESLAGTESDLAEKITLNSIGALIHVEL